MGTMLDGSTAQQFWDRFRAYDPAAFGFTGRVETVSEMINSYQWDCKETMAIADAFVVGSSRWIDSPESLASSLSRLSSSASVLGTGIAARPDHVKALSTALRSS
jgi:hypothetical protein